MATGILGVRERLTFPKRPSAHAAIGAVVPQDVCVRAPWSIVGFVACAALATLVSACDEDADPAETAGPSQGPTVAANAGPQVATGRVLAALAAAHLDPDQARSLEGFGGPDGATAIIYLRSGPGDRLYVSTVSPTYAPTTTSCAQARRQMAKNYELVSCEEIPGGVLEVLSSPPGTKHAILGYRIDGTGQVGAWIETSDDDNGSRNLVIDVLRDPRLGYRVDASTVNEAAALNNYEDIEVTTEVR